MKKKSGGQPGNKGGGRQKLSVELIKRAKELHHEEIAKDILTQHLEHIRQSGEVDFYNTKSLALPVVLRNTEEKKKLTVDIKQITGTKVIKDGA